MSNREVARPARNKKEVNDLIHRGNRLVPSKDPQQRAADEEARRLIATYKTHPRQR